MKTKCGLSRHMRLHEEYKEFQNGDLNELIEKTKNKLIEDECYPQSVKDEISKINMEKVLTDPLLAKMCEIQKNGC